MTAPHSSAPAGDVAVPWAVLPDYRCFGCSPHNHQGLRLRFAARDDGIESRFRLGRAFESYPGVVHGGIVSTICDETMGNLLVLSIGTMGFTTALKLRYVAALSVDTDYVCVARLFEAADPESGLVRATADVLDTAGDTMVTASATYRLVPLTDIRRHMDLSGDDARLLEESLRPIGARQGGSA